MKPPAPKPTLIINGLHFENLEGFAREFSKHLVDYEWRGHLDAFNDILRGGFGTPEGGFVVRWTNSDRSRSVLGPSLFSTITDIIKDHGPGGAEAEDKIDLVLD